MLLVSSRIWTISYDDNHYTMGTSTRPSNNQQKEKKRTGRIVDFTVLADHRVKLNESETRDKYLDLAGELKSMEHHKDGNYNRCTRNNPERIDIATAGLGNKRTSRDHPNCYIVKIDQNTEKSRGDLRRLAVTQAQVENN